MNEAASQSAPVTPTTACAACDAPSRRCIVIGGVIVFVVAALLRFINLGGPDLWLDEVWAFEASNTRVQDLLRWDVQYDPIASPLPWLEMKISKRIFGVSPVGVRFPSAFWGAAAAVMLYLLIGRAYDWRVAFFSALMLALSPFAVDLSREGRMYGHWLFWSLAMASLAWDAVRRVREGTIDALNWRWWLLGILFMVNHAVNVHAAMSIGGVGLWLGIMGLVEMVRQRRVGWRILIGAAISTGVYLSSWALTGIGRVMSHTGGGEKKPLTGDVIAKHVHEVIIESSGDIPIWIATLLWLVAIAGVVLLAMRGRWRLALLMAMVGLMNWVAYPVFAARHMFPPRYVTPMAILFAVGVGAMIALLYGQARASRARQIGAAAAVLTLVALWLPSWNEIARYPKESLHDALASIQHEAVAGDMVTVAPDFYFCVHRYYGFGDKATLMMPPMEWRTFQSYKNADPAHPPEPFKADFAATFREGHDTTTEPPAVWVLVGEPGEYMSKLEPLLKAYGLTDPAVREKLDSEAAGAGTVTFRVSRGGIDHITATRNRVSSWQARLDRMLGRD